jgi:hypothetical protein
VKESGGLLSNRNFSKINDLADQGSRIATHIRGFKNWFWKLLGSGTIAGGASTLVDTSKGNGAIAASHPTFLWVLLGVAVGAALIGLAAYLYLKLRIEPHLLTAANDGRYAVRKGE